MPVTPREAVKTFAVSRATLLKDLSKGKVSGARDDKGNWQIDPAELLRVYPYRPAQSTPLDQPRPDQLSHVSPPTETVSHDLAMRLARAEIELAAEREKNTLLQRHLDDVRRMLPAPDAKPARRWWWQRA